MISNRTDMVKYLRDLMESIRNGDTSEVMEFVNSASVRIDTESILGRKLTQKEMQDTGNLLLKHTSYSDAKLAQARCIAENLQNVRKLCRTQLQLGRAEGTLPSLQAVLCEVEAYAG